MSNTSSFLAAKTNILTSTFRKASAAFFNKRSLDNTRELIDPHMMSFNSNDIMVRGPDQE